jgi:hypothetical protein
MQVKQEPGRAVDFTVDVIESLKKRSRAIRHRGATVEWCRVQEIEEGRHRDIGRVDIDVAYRVRSARVSFRLIVWGDRQIWVDVRRASKVGWVWAVTLEGRFVSANGARDLVERIEQTLSASWGDAEEIPSMIGAVWSKSLAKGPRAL